MTINNEDVCIWYGRLKPASRIEFLSGFLRLLLPWELRFIGSCLEDLARRDFHVFRESEQRANNLSLMQKISSLHSFTNDEFRALLTVSLALLHSTNVQCATLYSDVLLWNFELARELVRYDEVSRQDIILLYNMAINHPAFTFDQRQTLCDCLRILQQIEKELTNGMSQQGDNGLGHIKMANKTNCRVMGISLLRTERTDGHTVPTYQYLFRVLWSNGEVTEVRRSLGEFCEFHEKLATYVTHHENAGGYQLPDVQIQQLLHKNEVPEEVLPILLRYVECLTNMPLHILHSEEVTHFFRQVGEAERQSVIGQCAPHQPSRLTNEELVSGADLDPFMTRSLQPSIPLPIVAKPSTTLSCSSPHNRSLSSINSRSSSGSLEMLRNSSTGSSPLSTPPSSSDGRNAPRLHEDAFTEDKFSDVIDLTKDTSRLRLTDSNKFYKSKQGSVPISDQKKQSWLQRTSTVGTNHRPAYSMSSLGEDGSGMETRVHSTTQSRPAPAVAVSSTSPESQAVYLQRLAAWLKANRMHKYLDRLSKYTYAELLTIERTMLQQEGFTQGAINKLMGMVEELVRNPQSFLSPVPVASASHRSSDSSTSTAGSAGSDNPSPNTSSPASPTPSTGPSGLVAEKRGSLTSAMVAPDGEAKEESETSPAPALEADEEADELGDTGPLEASTSSLAGPLLEGPAVATVQPLVIPQSPQPPQTPIMVMYPSASPAGYYYSPGAIPPVPAAAGVGPAPSNIVPSMSAPAGLNDVGTAGPRPVQPPPMAAAPPGYIYYAAIPNANPVHGPPMAPSRPQPAAQTQQQQPQPPVSSPQPVVATSQAGNVAPTPGVLLLRPGPAALQTVGSSVFNCTCQLCQQQQQQQPQPSVVTPNPVQQPQQQTVPHHHQQQPHNHQHQHQHRHAPPAQQTYMWPNGLVYACPGVSYPCCVTAAPTGLPEHQSMVPVTAGYVPQPGSPMMPFASGQSHYYPPPSGAIGFGLPGPSHYYSCYPPVQQSSTMPTAVVGPSPPRRTLTCYNCGVPGHKSAECQEKTIDCLMSDSYFHLKYQPTESYGVPGSRSSPNTPTGGGSASLEQ